MSKPIITDSLIEKVQSFLGTEGLGCFREYKKEHGKVNPVFMDRGIPHPVHFREGLQVRNFLRNCEECSGWDHEDLDRYWAKVVEQCLEKNQISTEWTLRNSLS